MTSALAPDWLARDPLCSWSRLRALRVRAIDTFGSPGPVARITMIWWRDLTCLAASLGWPASRQGFGSGSTWASPPGSAAQPTPAEGRSSVSTEQAENLEAILRQSAFPAGSSVSEQRRQLAGLAAAQPLPADVTVTAAALGGVPTAEITVDGIEPRHVVVYFHGGVYVLGTPPALLAWPPRSAGGPGPRSSPSTTGSPPSTRTRPRSTTPWPPTRPSCKAARPRQTSPSPGSPPAAGSPWPPWSTPAITGYRCPPRPSPCPRTPT